MSEATEKLRIPPQDLEAEKCAIAAYILADDVLRANMRAITKAEHFYSEDHAIIWRTCIALTDSGKALDAVSVRAEMVAHGTWEDVGGMSYMADILGTIPSAAHGERYAEIVRNTAIGRWAIRLAERVISRVHEPGEKTYTEIAKAAEIDFAKLAVGASMTPVVSLLEASMQLYEMLGQSKPRFICTGFYEIDDLIGGLPVGGFTLIGALPGGGKSAMAKQIMLNIGEKVRCGIISLEEDRYKISANALSNLSGVQNSKIMFDRLAAEDMQQLAITMNEIGMRNVFISDTSSTISEIESAAAILKHKHGCRVIFIDHLHIVDAETKENRTQQVSKISRAAKILGRKLDVAMVGLCQLNRGEGTQDAKQPPTLRRFKESGNLEADGDVILGLHRPDYFAGKDDEKTGELQVHILKNKNGATGMAPLHWDGNHQRINDWNPL